MAALRTLSVRETTYTWYEYPDRWLGSAGELDRGALHPELHSHACVASATIFSQR